VCVALGAGAAVVVSTSRDDAEVVERVGAEPSGTPAGGLSTPFVGFDGTPGTLERYIGTPIVVNFFASWCTPCLAELPGFERVHHEVGEAVRFVGLNLADDPAAGRAIVEQAGITYDVARDPDGDVFAALGAIAMPATVFVDADGRVLEVHGGELSAGALAERIEALLL
jgi:thiol-disulfide isomerase/thioredoxin